VSAIGQTARSRTIKMGSDRKAHCTLWRSCLCLYPTLAPSPAGPFLWGLAFRPMLHSPQGADDTKFAPAPNFGGQQHRAGIRHSDREESSPSKKMMALS
jgi:hypothetical protein